MLLFRFVGFHDTILTSSAWTRSNFSESQCHTYNLCSSRRIYSFGMAGRSPSLHCSHSTTGVCLVRGSHSPFNASLNRTLKEALDCLSFSAQLAGKWITFNGRSVAGKCSAPQLGDAEAMEGILRCCGSALKTSCLESGMQIAAMSVFLFQWWVMISKIHILVWVRRFKKMSLQLTLKFWWYPYTNQFTFANTSYPMLPHRRKRNHHASTVSFFRHHPNFGSTSACTSGRDPNGCWCCGTRLWALRSGKLSNIQARSNSRSFVHLPFAWVLSVFVPLVPRTYAARHSN